MRRPSLPSTDERLTRLIPHNVWAIRHHLGNLSTSRTSRISRYSFHHARYVRPRTVMNTDVSSRVSFIVSQSPPRTPQASLHQLGSNALTSRQTSPPADVTHRRSESPPNCHRTHPQAYPNTSSTTPAAPPLSSSSHTSPSGANGASTRRPPSSTQLQAHYLLRF